MKGMSIVFAGCLIVFCFNVNAALCDFEDFALEPQSYWGGAEGVDGFTSGGASFNTYLGQYSWAGFACSNITDTVTEGWSGQCNAIAGSGQGGSANYAVAYMDSFNGVTPAMTLNQSNMIDHIYVTNNNYAYYSMLNGDAYAKKFGGPTGDDPDWFLLTLTGKDTAGEVTGVVDFYLADFRFEDNGQDYILDDWAMVDLTGLGAVKTVEFTFTSSDVGDWGMNTPAYCALDTIVPEPVTLILLGFGGLMIKRKK